jgi:glycosyltransferase involved in cell wall biosynthesis
MDRPTLGLALIVKNEAENLPRLFKSLEGCFDEIIVTDTGSTDDTVKVAESLGATVKHFTWCDDFSAARNASFEPMTTDYVMWLDADDVLEAKDEFLVWRDNIMHLADFWIANYIYAEKPDGTPLCTFIRERVVKRTKGFKWRYFVHEGMVPTPDSKVTFIPSWRVRHKRTAEDLAKDHSRNLHLFEKNASKIDSRMMFYWGKELFENGKQMDAVRKLEDVLGQGPGLELHDRILAMQYLAMAYQYFKQHEKAIHLAYQGLALCPNRAEFYITIADCYVTLNQLQNAIPAYVAASNCHLPQGYQVLSPVFFNEECYTTWPRSQLAKIYAQLGQFDKAKSFAQGTFEQYGHADSKNTLDVISQMQSAQFEIERAVPCRDIIFTCLASPYTWDGDVYRKQAMGGSETACIEMAEWLAKLSGKPVKVFNPRESAKTVNGVDYIPISQLSDYTRKNRPYLHIAWRHNNKVTPAPTYVWAHDLITPNVEDTRNYKSVICLTPFHRDFMHNMQMVPLDKIWVSRNGIAAEKFRDPGIVKNPNKIVFPSSPDRGLDRAILIMDRLIGEFPDLKLHVFYGIEHLPKWGHQALYDKLVKMIAERPHVIYHGKTEQTLLHKHFREASLWLHPCDFIETSCITAMEMIACGVYPVTRALGGLKDTLKEAREKGMATLLPHDCVTESEFEAYTQATREALLEKKWEHPGFASFDPESVSWEKVARSWLEEMDYGLQIVDIEESIPQCQEC